LNVAIPTRNLSVDAIGDNVSRLQKQLVQIDYTVRDAEHQASTFGQGTHDAVAQFQAASGLSATGIPTSMLTCANTNTIP
jgi:peptidoglycan hydrolase-like protein with peptidoglycan-binding domain